MNDDIAESLRYIRQMARLKAWLLQKCETEALKRLREWEARNAV